MKEPDPYHTELMDIRRTGDWIETYPVEDLDQARSELFEEAWNGEKNYQNGKVSQQTHNNDQYSVYYLSQQNIFWEGKFVIIFNC